jgi:hypothetical protein
MWSTETKNAKRFSFPGYNSEVGFFRLSVAVRRRSVPASFGLGRRPFVEEGLHDDVIGKALIRDVDDVMTGRSLAKKGIFGKHTFNDKATRKRTLEVSVRKSWYSEKMRWDGRQQAARVGG